MRGLEKTITPLSRNGESPELCSPGVWHCNDSAVPLRTFSAFHKRKPPACFTALRQALQFSPCQHFDKLASSFSLMTAQASKGARRRAGQRKWQGARRGRGSASQHRPAPRYQAPRFSIRGLRQRQCFKENLVLLTSLKEHQLHFLAELQVTQYSRK